jgi:hypothetical protein
VVIRPDWAKILPFTTAFGSVLRLASSGYSDTLQIISRYIKSVDTNRRKHRDSETGIRLLSYSMEQIPS